MDVIYFFFPSTDKPGHNGLGGRAFCGGIPSSGARGGAGSRGGGDRLRLILGRNIQEGLAIGCFAVQAGGAGPVHTETGALAAALPTGARGVCPGTSVCPFLLPWSCLTHTCLPPGSLSPSVTICALLGKPRPLPGTHLHRQATLGSKGGTHTVTPVIRTCVAPGVSWGFQAGKD